MFDTVQGNHTAFGADHDQGQGRRQTEGSGEPIGCKWVYQRKINPDESTLYKARLVIKGYAQKEGIDYDETNAPVNKLTTIRLLLALSAQHGWNVDHMDVVTVFLNPKINQDNIHMAPSPGIECIRKKKIASLASGRTRRSGRFRRNLLNWDTDCHGTVHPVTREQKHLEYVAKRDSSRAFRRTLVAFRSTGNDVRESRQKDRGNGD